MAHDDKKTSTSSGENMASQHTTSGPQVRRSEHHNPASSHRQTHVATAPHDEVSGGASLATSAALIAVGALLEPELLGGMLLGAGAVYAASNLPLIGGVVRPLVSTVVKAGYAAAMKANEMIAEMSEDVQDMVAEARTEYQEPRPLVE